MGFYDNELECYVRVANMEYAHWFKNTKTGTIVIVPQESDDFDVQGDDEIWEVLQPLMAGKTDDDIFTCDLPKGIERVPVALRRFNPQSGFFSA